MTIVHPLLYERDKNTDTLELGLGFEFMTNYAHGSTSKKRMLVLDASMLASLDLFSLLSSSLLPPWILTRGPLSDRFPAACEL